ncbi:hypothetical protein RFI_21053, partial [Reticulomyxa filosa]
IQPLKKTCVSGGGGKIVDRQKKNVCKRWAQKYPKVCLGLWFALGVILLFLGIQMFWFPGYMHRTVHQGIRDNFIFTKVDESNSNYNTWATGGDVPIWLEVWLPPFFFFFLPSPSKKKKKKSLPHFFFKHPIISQLCVTCMNANGTKQNKTTKKTRFFNITNPEEVLAKGVPPKIEIVGPLVYVDNIIRYNVSFSEDKEWATYRYWEYYTLDTERQSTIKPTDIVTIIAPWVGAFYHWYYESGKYDKDVLEDIFSVLSREDPKGVAFLTDTAENILFHIVSRTFNGTNHSITVPFGYVTNYSIEDDATYPAPWETTHTGFCFV